jgi:hypothetical protein
VSQTFLERYGPPAPDRGLPAGCLPLVVAVLLVPGLGIFAAGGALRWVGVPLVFGAVALGLHWLFGRALLAAAWFGGLGRGKRGVLITSDSPHWQQHIEERWLPRLGDRLALINWSERSRWRETLAVLIWRATASSAGATSTPR